MRVRLAPCVRVRLWSLRRNRHSQQEKHLERGCDCGFCFCTERTDERGEKAVKALACSRRRAYAAHCYLLCPVALSPQMLTSICTDTSTQTHARKHAGGSPLALFVLEGNNVAKMIKSVATVIATG
jgi:hypothetical protein